jgi:hypothetical protein
LLGLVEKYVSLLNWQLRCRSRLRIEIKQEAE